MRAELDDLLDISPAGLREQIADQEEMLDILCAVEIQDSETGMQLLLETMDLMDYRDRLKRALAAQKGAKR